MSGWVAGILSGAALIAALLAYAELKRQSRSQEEMRRQLIASQERELNSMKESLLQETQEAMYRLGTMLERAQQQSGTLQAERLNALTNAVSAQERRTEAIQETVERRMAAIQEDTGKRLEEMRATVDEKLQKTLDRRISESFQAVNERLEQVYRGLGEMQNLAAGVGDLKKVLSGVKTRGILGELQLGAILQELLSREQYETDVVTKRGSRMPVEYAVKLPGTDGNTVYLPIDSKFPGDTYAALQDAYESGSKEAVTEAANTLVRVIRSEARDIRDKYIDPPHTTDFAILFLPFEGLYAEAVRQGLVESLQREYHITLAGPTTLAALLNALQMGFRTLAIQKSTGAVWQVLGAVKTEFEKFEQVLSATQTRLNQAGAELDKLVGVRTRMMRARLRDVTELSPEQSAEMLEDET